MGNVMKQLRKILFIGLLALLSLALASAYADGDAASINGTGYATVQAAIDAAQAGETVKLERDVIESVSITKSITLDLAGHLFQAPAKDRAILASGCELTIIDSAPDTPHQDVPTAYPDEWGVRYKDLSGGVFCGFTGKNAAGKNLDGCVNITNGKLTMTGGTFYGNHTLHNSGGAYLGQDVTASFEGVNFIDNIGQNHGGAIFSTGAATCVTVKDCLFDGNISYRGGAIKVETGDTISISGSTFTNNESWQTGAGVHLDHAKTVNITESDFHGNTATGNGGGIYTHTIGKCTITKTKVYQNLTHNTGAGLYMWGNDDGKLTDYLIEDCEFYENVGPTKNAGTIFIVGSYAQLKKNYIHDNVTRVADGIYLYYETDHGDPTKSPYEYVALIDDCTITDNISTVSNGAGIYVYSTVPIKGKILNSVIKNNQTAKTGSSIMLNAIGDFVLDGLTITGNKSLSGSGSGIYLNGNGDMINVTVTNSKITQNTASDYGGGIALNKNAVLTLGEGAIVCNNLADLAASDIFCGSTSTVKLNDASKYNELYQNTGIRIDGWYRDNPPVRYTQETGERWTETEYSGQYAFIAAVGKDARTYHVTYQTSGDAVYGLPEDYIEPVDPAKYNLNDLVTVVQTPTTACDYATVGGRKVYGKWTFASWSTSDFNISADTTITGAWKFTPNVPATGDTSRIGWCGTMLVVSLAALLCVFGLKKKHRNARG